MKFVSLFLSLALMYGSHALQAEAPWNCPDNAQAERLMIFNNYPTDTQIFVIVHNGLVIRVEPTKDLFRMTHGAISSVFVKTLAGKLLMAWMYTELKNTRSITVAKVENEDTHVIEQEFEDDAVTQYSCT